MHSKNQPVSEKKCCKNLNLKNFKTRNIRNLLISNVEHPKIIITTTIALLHPNNTAQSIQPIFQKDSPPKKNLEKFENIKEKKPANFKCFPVSQSRHNLLPFMTQSLMTSAEHHSDNQRGAKYEKTKFKKKFM